MQITINNLIKRYDEAEKPAVDDISLHVESGEFFFLLGPSGCGKTTLLRLIAGLIHPTSGSIAFDGEDVTEREVDQRGAAMVFQGYALWPHMTVQENVEFGPRMRGADKSERHRIASEQLQRVEMDTFADRKPNQLSGGQQQRVALARALAAGTRCLLFDEPLSNLDARLRLHMRDELKALVDATGVTGIYVTHDQKEALSMADRIAVINDGRIAQLGTPTEVYRNPQSRFVADFLGEANFLDGELDSGSEVVTTPAGNVPVASELTGRVTCCVRPESVRVETGNSPGGLAATVVSTVYLGDSRQTVCRLETPDAIEWRVTELPGAGEALAPGTPVSLTFSAGDVAVLDR